MHTAGTELWVQTEILIPLSLTLETFENELRARGLWSWYNRSRGVVTLVNKSVLCMMLESLGPNLHEACGRERGMLEEALLQSRRAKPKRTRLMAKHPTLRSKNNASNGLFALRELRDRRVSLSQAGSFEYLVHWHKPRLGDRWVHETALSPDTLAYARARDWTPRPVAKRNQKSVATCNFSNCPR